MVELVFLNRDPVVSITMSQEEADLLERITSYFEDLTVDNTYDVITSYFDDEKQFKEAQALSHTLFGLL